MCLSLQYVCLPGTEMSAVCFVNMLLLLAQLQQSAYMWRVGATFLLKKSPISVANHGNGPQIPGVIVSSHHHVSLITTDYDITST